MTDLTKIWDEDKTLNKILQGHSIARYGEGELRYACYGIKCKSQEYDPQLAKELLKGLGPGHDCLVALPRLWDGMPAQNFWWQFQREAYSRYYRRKEYGSAFISRSDVALKINRPDYWNRVKQIWDGKNVTIIGHSANVLPLSNAASVRWIKAPPVDAWTQIDRLEKEASSATGPVLMCLGATATVLAIRLAKKGVQALDLGHMGAFMPHDGAFCVGIDDLISPEYCEQQRKLHASPEGYGNSSVKQVKKVMRFCKEHQVKRLIDYGCGQGKLRIGLAQNACKTHVVQYDPAVRGMERIPRPEEFLVCTDVLEHVEPHKLEIVMHHLANLAEKYAFLSIATRKANKILPDGRNAHLIVQGPDWWRVRVQAAGFKIDQEEIVPDHCVDFWCSK